MKIEIIKNISRTGSHAVNIKSLKKETVVDIESDRRLLVLDAALHAIFQKQSSFVAFVINGDNWQEAFPKTDADRTNSEYTNEDSYTRRLHENTHLYYEHGSSIAIPKSYSVTQGFDMTGNTVAHAFSITKSMMGMLWAHYIYDEPERFPALKDWILADAPIGDFLNANRPVTSSLPLLLKQPLRNFFTQSTGLHTSEFSLSQALTLTLLTHKSVHGDTGLEDFNSFLHDNWIEEPLENCFNYDNLLTQVASFALKDYMSRETQNDKYLVKDDIIARFFPKTFSDSKHKHITNDWPVVYAGYEFYYSNGKKGMDVYNSITLAGLKMTGNDFIELGKHLLANHRELLIKIHDDEKFYVTIPINPEEIKQKGHSSRSGWRYSFFCWIPIYADEDPSKRKWIAFVGHEGQYMLMELVSKSLFIRQHFAHTAPAFENIDFAGLAEPRLQKIVYSDFIYDSKILLDELEYISKQKKINK